MRDHKFLYYIPFFFLYMYICNLYLLPSTKYVCVFSLFFVYSFWLLFYYTATFLFYSLELKLDAIFFFILQIFFSSILIYIHTTIHPCSYCCRYVFFFFNKNIKVQYYLFDMLCVYMFLLKLLSNLNICFFVIVSFFFIVWLKTNKMWNMIMYVSVV